MKTKQAFSSKKSMIASGVAIGVVALLTAFTFAPRNAHGDFDLAGLNQQVQHNTEQLNNHEARITNNENDIKALQSNTNTAPSTTRSDVPAVTTAPAPPSTSTSPSAPAASPAPEASSPVVTRVIYYPADCPGGPYYQWQYSDGHTENHPDSGGRVPSGGAQCTNKQVN